MIRSPGSIAHLTPSTLVKAPCPSTTSRSAAGVWWWLGAASPGRMICSPAKRVEVTAYAPSRPGFFKTSTRRSACSIGTSRAASSRSGRRSCHRQRCGTAAVTRSFGRRTWRAVQSGPRERASSASPKGGGRLVSRVVTIGVGPMIPGQAASGDAFLTCIHLVCNRSPPMTTRARARTYLADTVYAALRQALLDREFDPGEPLTELELSRRFRVSRTPVREALAKLERDHLVRVVPKKGAFVRTLSHDELRDLYEVREELEGFEARFRELRARGSRATATEVRPPGEELHQYLLKRAENAKLVDVLEHMREQVRPVWTMAIVAPRRVQALVREHLAIIDALKRRDVRRAERLMTLHVRRVRDAIFRLVD